MPRSKSRKQNRKPNSRDFSAPSAQTPPPAQAANHTFSFRFLVDYVKEHPLVKLALLFVALVGVWQTMETLIGGAEIHVADSDPTSPFVFPFTVKNSSKLFKLTDVEWTCHVSHMEFGNNNTADDMAMRTIGKQSTVDAGDISNHVCNVMNPGVPIHKLNMDVTVHYTILSYFHPSANKPFTWMTDGERSKWIEGNVD
jgi:hypothetical protein